MYPRTAYDEWKDAPKYQLPHDLEALRVEWWTASEAAREWGVSPSTARRYMERTGEATTVIVRNVRRDRTRVLHCVRAGTPAPQVRRGNPRFSDPEWQRTNSGKRWDGHITHAQLQAYKAELEAEAFEAARDQARRYLEGEDASC